jgi:hypothetical protein
MSFEVFLLVLSSVPWIVNSISALCKDMRFLDLDL